MKKLNIVLIFTIFSLILITGCSSGKMHSSVMSRTVGIGESALPIERGSFSIETFAENATNVDVISRIDLQYWADIGTDELLIDTNLNTESKFVGINGRYGFDNYTEVQIGLFIGETENSYNLLLNVNGDEEIYYDESSLNSTFSGGHIGIKRLLTDYNNPTRLSLYLEAREIHFTNSRDSMSKYNGRNTEFKSALILGYLDDPSSRNLPSVSLFYSLANTSRKSSISGLSADKHPQAIGAEANFNLAMGAIYANVSTGLEKEIVDKATDDLVYYSDFRIGFHFLRTK